MDEDQLQDPEDQEFFEDQDPVDPPEPVYVQVRYNGKTYSVPEEVADAWHARDVDYQRSFSAQGAELGRARQALQQMSQPQPQRREPGPDADVEFFSSPTEHLQRAVQESNAELEARLRAEFARTQAQNNFWSEFYREHPDLRDDNDVVQSTLERIRGEIGDLPLDQARRLLGERVRTRLGKAPQGEKKTLNTRQAVSERPSNGRPAPVQSPQQDNPKTNSLSAAIRARAEARRRAAHRIKEEK